MLKKIRDELEEIQHGNALNQKYRRIYLLSVILELITRFDLNIYNDLCCLFLIFLTTVCYAAL